MLLTVAAKRGWWRRSRMKSSSWRRSWTWPSATIWCMANASRSAEAVASAGVGAARAGVVVAIAAIVATITASRSRRVGGCMGRLSLWAGGSGEVARQRPAADRERHQGEVDEQQPERREHGDVVRQARRGTDELEGQVVADAASGSALRRQGLRDAPDDDDAHRARVQRDRADQSNGRPKNGAAECRAGEHEGDISGAEAGVDVIAGGDGQDD